LHVDYGPEVLPTYYLPLEDVDASALVDRHEGENGMTRWSVQGGGMTVADAAYGYPSGAPRPELAGHISFSWKGLRWFEEEQRVFVHARDPYKRVDVLPSSRHVRVELDGQVLAESRRPSLLFESWLPTRFYLPPQDVRAELLVPSRTVTACPYKGVASYWSVQTGERTVPDLMWSYRDPIPELPGVRGLFCFYNEHVDLFVDGEPQQRPTTPWSIREEGAD
jgi:uncharacterized protein (DUF427 family)